ncbi:MAG: RcnB family protein [Rhodospirillales bacterium]|nr:RcnB family protein [Rhodospirillales bacterium]
MRTLLFVLALFAVAATGQPVSAQSTQDIIFKEMEKRLIRETLGRDAEKRIYGSQAEHGKKAKNGRGKGKHKNKGRNGGLPPGLQKQLARNGTLPPGLAKKELPPGLSRELGPPPPGTQRYIVNNDVVLIQEATNLILDVITDVLK